MAMAFENTNLDKYLCAHPTPFFSLQSEVSAVNRAKRKSEEPYRIGIFHGVYQFHFNFGSQSPTLLPYHHLQPDQATTAIATSMDDFLKNIYGESSNHYHPHLSSSPFVHSTAPESSTGDMTLEDFLSRAAGAARDDVMRIPPISAHPPPPPPPQCFATAADATSSMTEAVASENVPFQRSLTAEGFGDGGGIGGGKVRGKRKVVEEPVLDKVTQQKQKRMIKNRESAARSRERKQAYTVDLESAVAHLKEENTRLLNEELMANVIPITEKRKPPRTLRRVNSMSSSFWL